MLNCIFSQWDLLTHWGRVTPTSVTELTVIGYDNGLAPTRRQAIIVTNDGYLNLCWNIINWTPKNKLQWNFNRNQYIFIQENPCVNIVCEMSAIFSRGRWVNTLHEKFLELQAALLIRQVQCLLSLLSRKLWKRGCWHWRHLCAVFSRPREWAQSTVQIFSCAWMLFLRNKYFVDHFGV